MVGDDLEKHPGGAPLPAPPRPTSARRTHGARSSVLLSMLPLPPGVPRPAAASLRPLLLDGELVAAQDGPGYRALAVLTLAWAPRRGEPCRVSGRGPQGRPHFAHPGRAAREPREQRLSVYAPSEF